MKQRKLGRRGLLGAFGALGGGALLQSLATGIPAQILLDPLSASAAPPVDAKMLILSVDRGGGSVNANCPGTYEHADIVHPPAATMAPTSLMLGDQSWTAAKPWADLSQGVLDRTCFFHHATYTPVHGEMARVLKMMDAAEKNDMLVSHLARELAPLLGTVQADPISLGAAGGELLSAAGRLLGNVPPTSVRQAFAGVEGPLANLRSLRDDTIDKVYHLYKRRGTPSQVKLLDAYVRSRDDVRNLETSLLSRFDSITNDGQDNQVRTAAILAAMKVSPVITVHINFGGDNHSDPQLARETSRHQTALASVQLLMDELDALKAEGSLAHDVIFGTLNVFGRSLKKQGLGGRDHNKAHHVMVMMGHGVRPGVIGGVTPIDDDYTSMAIDSATGAADSGGDIPFEETLGAAGKTLGALVGVPEERMHEILPPGRVVESVFA